MVVSAKRSAAEAIAILSSPGVAPRWAKTPWARSANPAGASGSRPAEATAPRFAGHVDGEGRLPQTGDQSVPKTRWIVAGSLLQRCNLTRPVGQDDAEGDLADIHEVRHSQRMPDLEVEVVPACLGIVPRPADAVEVAVDPVHRGPTDAQPTPAVNPRSPLPGTGHASLWAGQGARQAFERIDVERGSVVQAEVEVGLRHVLPTGPAATEQYGNHAVDLTQPLPQLPQILIIDHPCIMPAGPLTARSHTGHFTPQL